MDTRTLDNLTIWQPDNQRGHVESYFLKLNDPAQNRALWLKFTLYCPKGKPAETVGECWGIAFDSADGSKTAAFKETYPVAGCKLARTAFDLDFNGNILQEGVTKGKLKGPAGDLSWDLTFTPGAESFSLFPLPWMYTAKLPKSKIKTPHPSSLFSGSYTLNGVTVKVNGVRGMQGHNWGSEHSHLYAWAHCSDFEGYGDDTYFEGFSGKIKVGPWVSPFMNMAVLQLRGKRYVWNGLKAIRSEKIRVETNRWQFEIEGKENRLVGSILAPKDHFIGLHYYNPKGEVSYCLNSKVSAGEIQLLTPDGKVIESLRTKQSFALEVLVKDPSHGIRMGA